MGNRIESNWSSSWTTSSWNCGNLRVEIFPLDNQSFTLLQRIWTELDSISETPDTVWRFPKLYLWSVRVRVRHFCGYLFPTIQASSDQPNQHHLTSVCVCLCGIIIETLKLSESEGKPPNLGPHVVVAMLILFFLLYLCIFLSTIYTLKQKSNNSLVVRLAIYGSVNRFFQACAITGKRGLFED